MEKRKREDGFTLIELMIVIAVIGILAIVLIPKVGVIKTQAKSAGIDTNMRVVEGYAQSVVNNYDQTSFPNFFTDLNSAFTSTDPSKEVANPFNGNPGIVAWGPNGGHAIEYFNNLYGSKTDADSAFISSNNPNTALAGEIVVTACKDLTVNNGIDIILYPHDQNGAVMQGKVAVVTP